MQLKAFLSESEERIRRDGLEGVTDTLYKLYRVGWDRLSRLDRSGVHVYDRDWDVLVVLDACRADLLAGVAPEYDFLGGVASTRSVASTSEEWLGKTFAPDRRAEMARTGYVTGNPFSDAMLDAQQFAFLDEVWKYGWDDSLGTVPADPLTDRAISAWRAEECERMIVHYMQPHFPSVPNPEFASAIHLDRIGEEWDSVWDRLRKGDVSAADIRAAYRENLRYVLESVDLLRTSIDADRVAVTADHANSFGSWGLYGHPRAPVSAIRTVPWCTLTARDTSGYEPTTAQPSTADADAEGADERVESMLQDLGYM